MKIADKRRGRIYINYRMLEIIAPIKCFMKVYRDDINLAVLLRT